jgi:hypothetical protein
MDRREGACDEDEDRRVIKTLEQVPEFGGLGQVEDRVCRRAARPPTWRRAKTEAMSAAASVHERRRGDGGEHRSDQMRRTLLTGSATASRGERDRRNHARTIAGRDASCPSRADRDGPIETGRRCRTRRALRVSEVITGEVESTMATSPTREGVEGQDVREPEGGWNEREFCARGARTGVQASTLQSGSAHWVGRCLG